MSGRTRILSRYAAAEAERLTCILSVLAAVALSVFGCWGASRYALPYFASYEPPGWAGWLPTLLWHALPGALWLWLLVRARSPRERLAARIAFAIALWTFWIGLWTPQDAGNRAALEIALLVGPMFGALVLLAFILTRMNVWRATGHAAGADNKLVEADDEWATEVLVDGKVRTVRTPTTGLRRRVWPYWALLGTVVMVFMSMVIAPQFICACGARNPMVVASCCMPAVWWLWLFIRAKSPRERFVAWTTFAMAVLTILLGLAWGKYI